MRSLVSATSLSLLLVLLGCGKPVSPPKEEKAAFTPPKEVDSRADKKDDAPPSAKSKTAPAFEMTVEEYAHEWKKDMAAATSKFKNKVVELTGAVSAISSSGSNTPLLTFDVPKGETIHCHLEDKQYWTKVSAGSKVTIRGYVFRSDLGPDMDPCELTAIGPNPAIVISSEVLAAEYAKDREATVEKYKDKTLILTGRIMAKSKDGGHVRIDLKGGPGIKVACWFPELIASRANPLKVGQTITVVDEINPAFQKANELYFTCYRVLIAKE